MNNPVSMFRSDRTLCDSTCPYEFRNGPRSASKERPRSVIYRGFETVASSQRLFWEGEGTLFSAIPNAGLQFDLSFIPLFHQVNEVLRPAKPSGQVRTFDQDIVICSLFVRSGLGNGKKYLGVSECSYAHFVNFHRPFSREEAIRNHSSASRTS